MSPHWVAVYNMTPPPPENRHDSFIDLDVATFIIIVPHIGPAAAAGQ